MNKTITDKNTVDEIINEYNLKKQQDITNESRAVICYIESKIKPLEITHDCDHLYELALKYDINEVFKAVDISANAYLGIKGFDGYDESVDNFIEKIGGILYNRCHRDD